MINNDFIQNSIIIERPLINDSLFPAEIWGNIISWMDFDNLPRTLLTSRFLKQISEKESWGLYCKKILAFPFNVDDSQKKALVKAFNQIESCFESFDASNQKKIMTFVEKCNQESIKNQINFTRNFCHFTIASSVPNERIQNVITLLLNQPTMPVVYKMKMLDFAQTKLLIVNPKFEAKKEDLGLIPSKYQPFKLSQVTSDYIANLCIHPENTFEENELVAVIDKGGLTNGESSLYFARILNKAGKSWRVNLELKETNQWACVQIKTPSNIGKFSKNTAFPSFCS